MLVVTVLYGGGYMMSEAQMTVGDLTSFLLYTVYVGISIAGKCIYTEVLNNLSETPSVNHHVMLILVICILL